MWRLCVLGQACSGAGNSRSCTWPSQPTSRTQPAPCSPPSICAAGGLRARFHVGDAPLDVQAAVGGGAQAVGVCTGIYTKQELEEAAPGAVVLDDLTDTAAVLRVLGLH